MENTLISINEAAQQLGVSRETVKNWGKRGILSLTYVGKSVHVTKESVDSVKQSAPKLVRQMQAVEALQEELDIQKSSCLEDIREYRLEKVLRRESAQRVNLYMEIFASLVDLIYEGKYDEREYKSVMMFMKGTSIDEIAEKLECSKQAVVNNIRKCNEVLFNLQPYARLLEEGRDRERKLKLLEKDREILLTMLDVCRNDETGIVCKMEKAEFELYLTPISEMKFSTRTRGALMSSYLDCLGDLVHYGNRLGNLRGMGSLSLSEVKEVLATQYHLTLGTRIPGWESIKRAFYGEKKDNAIYEKLFEMEDDAKEYMEAALAELPEERVKMVRNLLQSLYYTGESCKKELEKYKNLCEGLRKQVKHAERCLENKDFYLSPAYEEVKALFARLEARGARQARKVTPEGELEPAVSAMGLLDCIFSQEAFQAESRRMLADWVKITKLEKDVRRLEIKMQKKNKKDEEACDVQHDETEERREEKPDKEDEAELAYEAEVLCEMEGWKKLYEHKSKKWKREKELFKDRERTLSNELIRTREQLRILKKDIAEKEEDYAEKEKNYIEKEGELLRVVQQDSCALWDALTRYENQVNAFNSRPWYQKLWQKMKKFSDVKKRLLLGEGV